MGKQPEEHEYSKDDRVEYTGHGHVGLKFHGKCGMVALEPAPNTSGVNVLFNGESVVQCCHENNLTLLPKDKAQELLIRLRAKDAEHGILSADTIFMIEELLAENKMLQNTLTDRNIKIEEFYTETDRLRGMLATIKTERDELKTERDKRRTDLLQMHINADRAQQQSERDRVTMHSDMSARAEKAEAELSTLRSENERLVAANDDRAHKQNKRFQEQAAKLAALKAERPKEFREDLFKEMEATTKQMHKVATGINDELFTASSRVKELEKELSALKGELSKERGEVTAITADRDSWRTNSQELKRAALKAEQLAEGAGEPEVDRTCKTCDDYRHGYKPAGPEMLICCLDGCQFFGEIESVMPCSQHSDLR